KLVLLSPGDGRAALTRWRLVLPASEPPGPGRRSKYCEELGAARVGLAVSAFCTKVTSPRRRPAAPGLGRSISMMRRSLLASIALASFTLALAVYAQDPTKGGGQYPGTKDKDGKPVLNTKELAAKEKELAEKYSAFEKHLLTLQQRLELSNDA